MKKKDIINLFLSLFLISQISLNAQNNQITIPFTIGQGGLIYVDVNINSIQKSYVFDTGASGISLSSSFYLELLNNNLINQSDFISDVDMIIANGQSVKAKLVRLKSVKINKIELNNIEAVVIPQPNAPLLIGQNVFANFGAITIDYNNKMIIINENNVIKSISKLDKVKIISCHKKSIPDSKKIMTLLKNNNKINIKKILLEKQIPRVKAIKRIKKGGVIRYFSTKDRSTAFKIKTELIKQSKYKNISIQNMIPYYKNRTIDGYIEIWLK